MRVLRRLSTRTNFRTKRESSLLISWRNSMCRCCCSAVANRFCVRIFLSWRIMRQARAFVRRFRRTVLALRRMWRRNSRRWAWVTWVSVLMVAKRLTTSSEESRVRTSLRCVVFAIAWRLVRRWGCASRLRVTTCRT